MASVVDIANLALGSCGAEGVLASLDDATKEGRLCKMNWPLSRRAVLRMHPWNFAIKRVALVPDANPPTWGYGVRYLLPLDCLRVLTTDDEDKVYKIEGRYLLTDETSMSLRYVYDCQDTTQYDDLFVQVLALHMAMKMTKSLNQSADQLKMIQDEFKLMMPKARHVDATEDFPPSLIADELVNTRIGPNRGWVRDPMT